MFPTKKSIWGKHPYTVIQPAGRSWRPLPLLQHEQHVLEPEQLPIAGPPADSGQSHRETPSHDDHGILMSPGSFVHGIFCSHVQILHDTSLYWCSQSSLTICAEKCEIHDAENSQLCGGLSSGCALSHLLSKMLRLVLTKDHPTLQWIS